MNELSYIGALSRDNERSFFVDFGIMPQETSSTPSFEDALALQQQKNWDGALAAYGQILDKGPAESEAQAAVIYHNMAAIAGEKGDFLKAYAWSRKSVSLNPGSQPAREAFLYYSKKFEVPSISHQISNLETLKHVLAYSPLDLDLVLSLALILGSLALAFQNKIVRKKKQLAEDFSPTPAWPVYLLFLLTLMFTAATWIRWDDSRNPHAIVLAEKAQVQTAPGENKPVIFEAPAGLEVEVLGAEAGYFQVRYPGAFSGWVNQSQLEILSLSFGQK